jgi:hypothetical protein
MPEIRLKQRTFTNILRNIGFDRASFSPGHLLAPPPLKFGGYEKSDFSYLVGRYLLFRRSFQNGIDISRAILDIT